MDSQQDAVFVKPVELSPSFLYALFARPIVRRCTLVDGVLVLALRTRGELRVPLCQVEWQDYRRGLLFSSVTLAAAGGPLTLEGLRSHQVDMLRQAHRSARVLDRTRGRWEAIRAAVASWRELLASDRYVANSDLARWREATKGMPRFSSEEEAILAASMDPAEFAIAAELSRALADPRPLVDTRNQVFTGRELDRCRSLFDSVESFPLTEQQRSAVVHDEDNALVVAGAGTGKTSTVMAKVAYILQRRLASPEQILLLAFTRKAAEEMGHRIETKQGTRLQVRTFHALGLEIIASSDDRKPAICREAEDEHAKRQLLARIIQELAQGDAQFRHQYVEYQVLYRVPYRSPWEFQTGGEYTRYLKDARLRSLKGELLKSQEEVLVADWLTLHGIDYLYEQPYEIETATREHRQYKPDFYLPAHRLYVEHFGLDRNGSPPPFVDRGRYLAGVAWKRELHSRYQTTLIETFSWEAREGSLFEGLARKLAAAGVAAAPVGEEKVLESLARAELLDPLAGVMATFLALFKGSGLSLRDVRAKAGSDSTGIRTARFIDLFESVYRVYQERLRGNREVDFEDMIVAATDYVREGRYASGFRYIIVDEFQDISVGRAALLRALRDQVSGAKLFAVGDDWQSIYRFSGADVSLMTNFAGTFGFTRVTALDQTYRFDQRLGEFTERFVLKNPAQLPKKLGTGRRLAEPPVQVVMRDEGQDPLPGILAQIPRDQPGGTSVLVLNRYRFTTPAGEYVSELQRAFPHLEIRFMTAHASKGLEADVVVVDNLRGGTYGFPSLIVDDPVLGVVLSRGERFPHAEERRLFYVAMTRARQRLVLVADRGKESSFVFEILKEDEYEKQVVGESAGGVSVCPGCQEGRLVSRSGQYGMFYGCSNYPYCEYKEQACPNCRKGLLRRIEGKQVRCDTCGFLGLLCPKCTRGVLVRRTGRYGPFMGCTMFSSTEAPCAHTEKLRS